MWRTSCSWSCDKDRCSDRRQTVTLTDRGRAADRLSMIHLIILLHIYFVSFTDKPQKGAPALSPRAIAQRTQWNIVTDEKDYPVCTLYKDSLRKMGVRIHHESRWFNGVTCEMPESLAEEVVRLRFVEVVDRTRDSTNMPQNAPLKTKGEWLEAKEMTAPLRTDRQLALYNLHPLHEAGYKGQGILMAVCDGGFYHADTLSCFRDSLRLGHFDFTDDKDDFFGPTGNHGTCCLSAISGIAEGFQGAATEAQYYLMRSEEYATESPKEMDNLVAALEKADSLGVNIFSVSLGYSSFDNPDWTLPKSALDGLTTRASAAATIAARKGMLVCVAAGNEGNKPWQIISVPADADSVLTVGAVDTLGMIGDFSSYGPSADGRVKPDVCAVGVRTTLINPAGQIVQSNGTSFATPLLAGLAACLWSALPTENAMQIRERIIRSADRYSTPDMQQYGYGIPDAWVAYTMNPAAVDYSFTEIEAPRKILRSGQILILHHGQVYNVAGQRVE